MNSPFAEVMARRTDADLLKIVSTERDTYNPDAIAAAERELERRNLAPEFIAEKQAEHTFQQEAKTARADAPLSTGEKVFTLLVPVGFFIQLIRIGHYRAKGYERKASELGRWILYGWGLYIGLIILLKLL